MSYWALLLTSLPIIFFWHSPVVYPVKLFVVLLHEISHGLAAVATGGSIVRIEISADLGGICYVRGGLPFAVLTAGYLGSMCWGGLILVTASRMKAARFLSFLVGGSVLTVTVLYVRNASGLLFGLLFAAAMCWLARWAASGINRIVLTAIGLVSVLYPVIDIKDDLITRQVARSDATMLAERYFGTSLMWGLIWGIMSLILAFTFIRMSINNGKQSGRPHSKRDRPARLRKG